MTEANFTHHTLAVAGEDVHFVSAGEGPPVVLLHGWPSTWFEWRAVIPHLAAAGYQVFALDTPGLGDSAAPAKGYAKLALAETVKDFIGTLGLGKVHLVGHDLGGQIAFAHALAFPETLRSVAILEIIMAGLQPPPGPPLWHWALHQVPGLIEELAAGRERIYLSHFYGHVARAGAIAPDEVDEYVRAYSRPGAFHRGIEYYRAFEQDRRDNQRLLEEGKRLTVPTYWVAGGKSIGPFIGQQLEAARPRHQGDESRHQQPAPEFAGDVIDGAGHWLPQEAPAEVSAGLVDFWRRLGG